MKFVDTHCHIHDLQFFNNEAAEAALSRAIEEGVDTIICIATTLEDSKRAIAFATKHPKSCRASIGIHPHEAADMTLDQIHLQLTELSTLAADPMVVAVGECGFDFFYNKREACLERQTQLLEGQLAIAAKHALPLSFHVRAAFDDFWPVFEPFKKSHAVSGVLHSFTDSQENADRAVQHGLAIGVNGIATFTKESWQRDLFKQLPLENIVVETDSPYLTPSPKRGTINEPRNVIYITKFLAELRGESEKVVADATTANAAKLFKLT